MVFTKPLDVEDSRLVYFEIVEPESLRYIYIGRPAKDFGVSFVSFLPTNVVEKYCCSSLNVC